MEGGFKRCCCSSVRLVVCRQSQARIHFPIFLSVFLKIVFFAYSSKTGRQYSIYISGHTDSTPRILLLDCHNLGLVVGTFPLHGSTVVFARGLLKSSLILGYKSHVVGVCVTLWTPSDISRRSSYMAATRRFGRTTQGNMQKSIVRAAEAYRLGPSGQHTCCAPNKYSI